MNYNKSMERVYSMENSVCFSITLRDSLLKLDLTSKGPNDTISYSVEIKNQILQMQDLDAFKNIEDLFDAMCVP